MQVGEKQRERERERCKGRQTMSIGMKREMAREVMRKREIEGERCGEM